MSEQRGVTWRGVRRALQLDTVCVFVFTDRRVITARETSESTTTDALEARIHLNHHTTQVTQSIYTDEQKA